MTQSLLALCFGLPVNANHGNGISLHKPLLSVYNNSYILPSSLWMWKHNTAVCSFAEGLMQLDPVKLQRELKGFYALRTNEILVYFVGVVVGSELFMFTYKSKDNKNSLKRGNIEKGFKRKKGT